MKEKSFEISIHFEGCVNYTVEAENIEEAKAKAIQEFDNESDRDIVSNIYEMVIADCTEQ